MFITLDRILELFFGSNEKKPNPKLTWIKLI